MNWKEQPNLFANGKFKVQIPSIMNTTDVEKFGINRNGELTISSFYPTTTVEDCTLIARPISDISDDELWAILDMWHDGERGKDYSDDPVFLEDHRVSGLNWICQKNRWDFKYYLLKVGIWPFDNENTNDIIWRYENTER